MDGHEPEHVSASWDRLPSDLTDPEWERLGPLIPLAKPGGRPRKTDMRSAMNAIFYLLRTGQVCKQRRSAALAEWRALAA